MTCAGLEVADLADWLRVDEATYAIHLERALGAACEDASQITGVTEIPTTERWQSAILMWAARLFSRRESPLGIAGGPGELGMPVRTVDPDIEALFARLTERAGFA
jgi:hypothetical protein